MKQLITALWLTALPGSLSLPAAAEPGLDAFYPEGPFIVGKAVFYAEMQRDRVIRWEGDDTRTFYFQRGCGPTAIAPYDEGYVVLCHLSDRLVILSARGAPLETVWRDVDLETFNNPNDASADDAGGVYFSASGTFSRGAPPEGELLYLDAEGEIHRLASGFQYTNGVVFDRDRSRLLVSEHLGNRIRAFPVLGPGKIGDAGVFADLTALDIGDKTAYPPQGPDGLEIDSLGNVYAAHYGGSELLIFSPEGDLRTRLPWSQPLITSVTLSPDERDLILTGSVLAQARLWPGRVERVANPLAE